MKKNVQISFAVIFLVLGIVISVQYKSMQKNKSLIQAEAKSVQDVQAQLLRQKEYSDSLSKQISEYQKKIENYEKNIDVEDMVKKDLEQARVLAGLADVKGKGVIITIDDTNVSNNIKGIVPDSNGYYVSYLDLLDVLNDLKAAGAEAISLNDERIISTSEVRSAGDFIRINNKKYNRPFTIKVIGDPSTLESSMRIREGTIYRLMLQNIDVTIKQDDNILIPKYNGIINFNYLNKV